MKPRLAILARRSKRDRGAEFITDSGCFRCGHKMHRISHIEQPLAGLELVVPHNIIQHTNPDWQKARHRSGSGQPLMVREELFIYSQPVHEGKLRLSWYDGANILPRKLTCCAPSR